MKTLPKTETPTKTGVERACQVVVAFVNELRFTDESSRVKAYDAAFAELTTFSFSKKERSCLYRVINALASLFDAGLDAIRRARRLRSLIFARKFPGMKRALSVFVVSVSYLASVFAPAIWGDWRLVAPLAPSVLLHYLLFSDSKPVQWLRDCLKFAPRDKGDSPR